MKYLIKHSEMDLLELSKDAVICAFNKLIELDKQGVKQYVFSDEIPKAIGELLSIETLDGTLIPLSEVIGVEIKISIK